MIRRNDSGLPVSAVVHRCALVIGVLLLAASLPAGAAAARLNMALLQRLRVTTDEPDARAAADRRLWQAYRSAARLRGSVPDSARFDLLEVLLTPPETSGVADWPARAKDLHLLWMLRRARADAAAGRFEPAGRLYAYLARVRPDSFEVLVEGAALEDKLRRYPAAIAILERAVTKAPRVPRSDLLDRPVAFWRALMLAEAYGELGAAYADSADYNRAVRALEKSRELHPAGARVSPWLDNLLGICYARLGQDDRARRAFIRALSKDPSIRDAREGLERLRQAVP
jgi:tetratricopeptide (TPR) repeat protein